MSQPELNPEAQINENRYLEYQKSLGKERSIPLFFEHLERDFPGIYNQLGIPEDAKNSPSSLKTSYIENKEKIFEAFFPYLEDAFKFTQYQYQQLEHWQREGHFTEQVRLQTGFSATLQEIFDKVVENKDINSLFASARSFENRKEAKTLKRNQKNKYYQEKQKSNLAALLIVMMQSFFNLPEHISETHRLLLNIRHENEENDLNNLALSPQGLDESLQTPYSESLSEDEKKRLEAIVTVLKEEHNMLLNIFPYEPTAKKRYFPDFAEKDSPVVLLDYLKSRHKKRSSLHRKAFHKIQKEKHNPDYPLEAVDFDGLLIVVEKEKDREKVIQTLLTYGFISPEKKPRLIMIANSIKTDVMKLIEGEEDVDSALTDIQKKTWKKLISIVEIQCGKDPNKDSLSTYSSTKIKTGLHYDEENPDAYIGQEIQIFTKEEYKNFVDTHAPYRINQVLTHLKSLGVQGAFFKKGYKKALQNS